jgi:hypothetical protein
MVPIPIVARETGRLQGEHGPDRAFTYGREQPAEARTRLLARAAHAEVVVDHDHAREPHVPRPIGEPVLPLLTLPVMMDLVDRRLPDVDVRGTFKMRGAEFLVHRRSLTVLRRAAPRAAVVRRGSGTGVDPGPRASATGRDRRRSAFAGADVPSGRASSPPMGGTVPRLLARATAASGWLSTNARRSRSADTEMRGRASSASCAQASGSNIQVGTATCTSSASVMTTQSAVSRRSRRTIATDSPWNGWWR